MCVHTADSPCRTTKTRQHSKATIIQLKKKALCLLMVILWWKNKLVAIVCVCVKLDWKKRRLANRKERLTRQPLIL